MSTSTPLLLSGFADEAANDKTIDQQFSAFAALGLKYFSIRFIDAGNGVKNVMQLNDAELELVSAKMDEYGLCVSSLGSPLGKVKLLDVEDGTSNSFHPFEEYLENDVRRACDLANRLGTKLIRGFSFYHPRGQNAADHMGQTVERLGRIAEACDSAGLTYGLEVEANLVGQNGEILADIHRQVANDALVLIFDGGNLVTQGFSPDEILNQYKVMKPGLGWIHIKDFRNPAGVERTTHVDEEALKHFVPAELGDSGHAAILSDLAGFLPELESRMKKRGADGVFADMEPHVKGGGQFGGFSGPDGFGVALRSFCGMCDQAGIAYRLRDFGDIQAARGF
ncbi:MAG: TIM barrel protein [Planctomycetota bacterium]